LRSRYWFEWRGRSILSVAYLCFRGTLQEEDGRYGPSKPAVSCLIDAHATTGSLTDCWMNIPLIDVADNWPECPTPPSTHTYTHPPCRFHKAELRVDSECEWRGAFSTRNFKEVEIAPAGISGRLMQLVQWWKGTYCYSFAPKDILLMNSKQGLQEMKSISSCLPTSRSTPAVAFELRPSNLIVSGLILLTALKSSSVSVGWWIVKECALFSRGHCIIRCWICCLHVKSIVFAFMLPCQALSFVVIQGVSGLLWSTIKSCVIWWNRAMDMTVFTASSVSRPDSRWGGGLLLSPRRKTGLKAKGMPVPDATQLWRTQNDLSICK